MNAMQKFGSFVLGLIALVVVFYVVPYSMLNSANQGQQTAWANIESTLERRADLIPNLVNTVKGYAAHEEQVFKDVAEARAKMSQVSIEIGSKGPTPEQMKALVAAQSQMGSMLSRLLAVSESNPDLKASEGFLRLQAQLEGTENRINVARKEYNAAVRKLNTAVNGIFCGWVARQSGFEEAEYFKASEGAAAVPSVDFE